MRDYNYRFNAKRKEQLRRKTLYYNRGYWPAMPHKGVDEYGEEYFTEGRTGTYKRFLKKQANKAVRNTMFDNINSGCNYKRVYSLTYMWY